MIRVAQALVAVVLLLATGCGDESAAPPARAPQADARTAEEVATAPVPAAPAASTSVRRKAGLPLPTVQPAPLPEAELVAWRQASEERVTAHRSEICLNGWWRFAPLTGRNDIPWGHLRVPGSWARSQGWEWNNATVAEAAKGEDAFWKAWNGTVGQGFNKAFYERTITVPATWRGRAVILDLARVSTDAKVYVDGVEAGAVGWPGGQVDLTPLVEPGKDAVLTVFVQASPEAGEVLTYWNTADDPNVTKAKGVLLSRGLIGDVTLIGRPSGAHLDDVFVQTSWRRHQVTIAVGLTGVAAAGPVTVTAAMLDGSGKEEQRFTAMTTVVAAQRQVVEVSWPWPDPRLWDLDAPQLYTCRLSVAGGGIADTYEQEFGFRETWIDGKLFKLNGTTLHLRPTIGNSDLANTAAGAAGWLAGLRAQGYNFGFLWADNLDQRSSFACGYETLAREADRRGFLLSGIALTMAADIAKWDKAGVKEDYGRRMAADLRRQRNHPSYLMWGTTANFFGHIDDYNPRNLGRTGYNDADPWWKKRADRGAEAIALIRKADPTRPIFTHNGSYVGDFNAANLYLNLIPLQEREDYLSAWAAHGERPYMAVEFEMPCSLTFRRTRKGYPAAEFGEPLVTEFCAGTLGHEAYALEEDWYRRAIITGLKPPGEIDPKNPDALWKFRQPGIAGQAALQKLIALNVQQVWRSWRTWGISGGMVPWASGMDWAQTPAYTESVALPPFQPGTRGMYLSRDQRGRLQPLSAPSQRIQPVGEAFQRNNSDLLAWIAGPAGSFTAKDHSFAAGQAVAKQAALLNDSRVAKPFTVSIQAGLSGREFFTTRKTGMLEPGETLLVPFGFTAPQPGPGRADGVIRLSAEIGGTTLEDAFRFRVFAPAAAPALGRPVVVLDPQGGTRRMLDGLGVPAEDYAAGRLAGGGPLPLVVIGRRALGADGTLPEGLEAFVRSGGRVLVMAQDPALVRRNWGFRTCGIRSRQVFRVAAGHPALAGCDDEDLRDWAGESRLVEPYPAPGHEPHRLPYYGFPWGTTGVVTSAAFEKPHLSGWTPILECEFDLQYSPLMELGVGAGRLILSALDLEDHWDADAAAAALARGLLAYAADAAVVPRSARVAYRGDARGEALLRQLGAIYQAADGADADLTILGPGADPSARPAGRVFCLPGARPDLLVAATDFHGSIQVPAWPEARGLSPADLHWRVNGEAEVLKPAPGFEVAADGLLGRSADGRTTLCQIDPALFDTIARPYLRLTRWRQTRTLAQLLANQGVEFAIDQDIWTSAISRARRAYEREKADTTLGLAGAWKVKLTRRLQATTPDKPWPDTGFTAEAKAAVQVGFDDTAWESRPVGSGNGVFCETYGGDWKDSDGESVFRRSFEIPAAWAGKDLVLSLGWVDDTDTTFVDGIEVGASTGWNTPRLYHLSAGKFAPGRHVVAVRVWDQAFDGGLRSWGKDLSVGVRLPSPPVVPGYYHPDYREDFVNGDDPYRVYPW